MSRHRGTRRGGQPAGRRLSSITLDQAVAGSSNVLIAVLAARILETSSFGLFGIVFLTYATVQICARALVCEPLLSHPTEARERSGEVLGTGLVLGLGLGGVLLLGATASYAWDARLGEAMLVLAVCMPLLALQDLGRYLGFATQRPASALTLDVVWLVLQLAAVTGLVLAGLETLSWFVAGWAGAGALAGLVVLYRHRGVRLRPGLAWLRTTWFIAWRYLLAALAVSGAALAGTFTLGLVAGTVALGTLIGAGLLVRPFMTFQIAVIAAAVSEIAHGDRHRSSVMQRVRRTSLLATVVALINLVLVLALPDPLGRGVLGETWDDAQALLLPTCLQAVLLGLITGPRAGLLGIRAVRPAMAIDLVGAAVLLSTTIGGALVNGALGVAWAVAAGWTLMASAWWVGLIWRFRGPKAEVGFDTGDAQPVRGKGET